MTIGSDYPAPVIVNGYSCKNCTDVGNAKKHIDPAHPRSGPYGINAKNDPTVKSDPSAAVSFGGSLSSLNDRQVTAGSQDAAQPSRGAAAGVGRQLDITA